MATYDPTTPAGQVRLLISDTDTSNPVFEDNEIDQFLALESQNVRRGAAMALDTIASNEVQVLKVIKLLDLTTNGAAVSKELRASSSELRRQADEAEAREDLGGFDFAEQVVNDFSLREFIVKDAERTS